MPDPRSFPTEFSPVPANRDPAELAIQPRVPTGPYQSRAVLGLGGGVRFADGEKTQGVVTSRVGYRLGKNMALSLRPSYIFYGSATDIDGFRTRNGSFQMPLTVDIFPDAFVSPYIGGGVASNADNWGRTDAMATAGLDFNIAENFTLGVNANYIFTNRPGTSDRSNGDLQIMTLLYLRPSR